MRRFGRTAAFSLFELLVALGVLALILVIGSAAYQRLSNVALVPQHLSNHRQIATALFAYGSDHRGSLPWSHDAAPSYSSKASSYTKTLVIFGYVSDPMTFVHPLLWRGMSEEWRTSWKLAASHPARLHSNNPWAHTGYGANRYGAMPSSGDGRRPANLRRVATDGQLSSLMILRDSYDARWDTPTERRGGGTAQFHRLDAVLPPLKLAIGGRIYATYADGHTASFTREELLHHADADRQAPLFRNLYTAP